MSEVSDHPPSPSFPFIFPIAFGGVVSRIFVDLFGSRFVVVVVTFCYFVCFYFVCLFGFFSAIRPPSITETGLKPVIHLPQPGVTGVCMTPFLRVFKGQMYLHLPLQAP